ncbi:hypothetical protein SCHPADRAFT_943950 [Schizopora paradoxa]|uniref:Uncharacterized protein n=1 Tax=Schizopora paradoxa TaxID=27342 RepID=A0A0H2RW75_9AGAM|nr:hypothetical protein SCHPADRAFT_943950 [Schizopora paradoxa]
MPTRLRIWLPGHLLTGHDEVGRAEVTALEGGRRGDVGSNVWIWRKGGGARLLEDEDQQAWDTGLESRGCAWPCPNRLPPTTTTTIGLLPHCCPGIPFPTIFDDMGIPLENANLGRSQEDCIGEKDSVQLSVVLPPSSVNLLRSEQTGDQDLQLQGTELEVGDLSGSAMEDVRAFFLKKHENYVVKSKMVRNIRTSLALAHFKVKINAANVPFEIMEKAANAMAQVKAANSRLSSHSATSGPGQQNQVDATLAVPTDLELPDVPAHAIQTTDMVTTDLANPAVATTGTVTSELATPVGGETNAAGVAMKDIVDQGGATMGISKSCLADLDGSTSTATHDLTALADAATNDPIALADAEMTDSISPERLAAIREFLTPSPGRKFRGAKRDREITEETCDEFFRPFPSGTRTIYSSRTSANTIKKNNDILRGMDAKEVAAVEQIADFLRNQGNNSIVAKVGPVSGAQAPKKSAKGKASAKDSSSKREGSSKGESSSRFEKRPRMGTQSRLRFPVDLQ